MPTTPTPVPIPQTPKPSPPNPIPKTKLWKPKPNPLYPMPNTPSPNPQNPNTKIKHWSPKVGPRDHCQEEQGGVGTHRRAGAGLRLHDDKEDSEPGARRQPGRDQEQGHKVGQRSSLASFFTARFCDIGLRGFRGGEVHLRAERGAGGLHSSSYLWWQGRGEPPLELARGGGGLRPGAGYLVIGRWPRGAWPDRQQAEGAPWPLSGRQFLWRALGWPAP